MSVDEAVAAVRPLEVVAAPVLAFAGYARSGKDTCANYLVENYGFRKLSFGETVMALLLEVDPYVLVEQQPHRLSSIFAERGYDGCTSIPDIRLMLQNLGSGLNDRNPHFLTETLMATRLTNDSPLAVSGVRTPEQADDIRKHGGLVVWVDRLGFGPMNGHRNEMALGREHCDLALSNSGTQEDLYQRLTTALSLVLPERT